MNSSATTPPTPRFAVGDYIMFGNRPNNNVYRIARVIISMKDVRYDTDLMNLNGEVRCRHDGQMLLGSEWRTLDADEVTPYLRLLPRKISFPYAQCIRSPELQSTPVMTSTCARAAGKPCKSGIVLPTTTRDGEEITWTVTTDEDGNRVLDGIYSTRGSRA